MWEVTTHKEMCINDRQLGELQFKYIILTADYEIQGHCFNFRLAVNFIFKFRVKERNLEFITIGEKRAPILGL